MIQTRRDLSYLGIASQVEGEIRKWGRVPMKCYDENWYVTISMEILKTTAAANLVSLFSLLFEISIEENKEREENGIIKPLLWTFCNHNTILFSFPPVLLFPPDNEQID